MITILASKGKYKVIQHPNGLYTVDLDTPSLGMTLFASDDLVATMEYFDKLGESK